MNEHLMGRRKEIQVKLQTSGDQPGRHSLWAGRGKANAKLAAQPTQSNSGNSDM